MNRLYANNKAIVFQLFLGIALFCHSLYGITVNDIPLEQVIQPGQALTVSCKEKDRFLLLEIKDNNLYVKSENIDYFKNLEEVFEERNSKKTESKSKSWSLSSNIANFNGSYLTREEYINIEARTLLNLNNCLIDSPDITITGNQINFKDCFLINPQTMNSDDWFFMPQTLRIIAKSSESNCAVIRITFNEESAYPTFITGELDLANNQTPRTLMVTNVKEIEIQFSPKALEN